VMTSTLRCGAMGRFWPYRTGAMHNVVYELRRILLLGTSVNDTNPSVRIHQNPKGRRNGRKRDRSLPIAGTLA
jgi:hypothetical protein